MVRCVGEVLLIHAPRMTISLRVLRVPTRLRKVCRATRRRRPIAPLPISRRNHDRKKRSSQATLRIQGIWLAPFFDCNLRWAITQYNCRNCGPCYFCFLPLNHPCSFLCNTRRHQPRLSGPGHSRPIHCTRLDRSRPADYVSGLPIAVLPASIHYYGFG